MPFLDANGCRFHYRFDGPAEAPVLVLSNSLGANLGMWGRQIPEFSRHFRVLRYDTRGHGATEVTPGPYTIGGLAGDVLALLDALGIGQAHFCGLSMGGMTGLWLGIHAPQRLRRLVLCNTSAGIGSPEVWDARIAAVQRSGMAEVTPAVIERWFTSEFRGQDPAAVDAVAAMLLESKPAGYAACCAAIRDMDQREAAARVTAPTLVIAGSVDTATPAAQGRFIAEQIAGASYVELPTAHLSNIEAADRFTETVSTFFTAQG